MGACQGKSLPLRSPNSTKLLGVLIRLPPRSYQIILVSPIKFLQFLSKNKRHIFHFLQELRSTTYSLFCSNTFCYFLGNFIIPSSPNFLSHWAKNCSRCLLQSSRELKFFPLTELGKDWNKWKSKSAMSGKYSGWIRTSQPSYDSFRLVIEEACSTVLSWRTFLTDSGGFRWVLLSVGLIGNSTCWN